MPSPISISPSSRAYGGTGPVRSPDLDAKLATCRSQLEDWVTCPSAKTPEGKARIQQITTKYNALKAQIKQAADDTRSTPAPEATGAPARTASASNAEPTAAAPCARPIPAGAVSSFAPGTDFVSPLGTRLDIFA